jgi:hypothetical protein
MALKLLPVRNVNIALGEFFAIFFSVGRALDFKRYRGDLAECVLK